MRINSRVIAVLVTLCVLGTNALAGIIVTPTNDASQLATQVAGTGLNLTGVGTHTDGAPAAFGTFTNGTDAYLPFNDGIILSTGNANDAEGPRVVTGFGTTHGTPGDSRLTSLLGTPTYDAAIFNFQFETSSAGNLNFDFALGTNQPGTKRAGTGDVFGFFLNGSPATFGAVTGNATYPGYSPGSQTYGSGSSIPLGDPNLNFAWLSDIHSISLVGLGAGVHQFSISIADGWSSLYDSALLLGEISLVGANTPVPIPATPLLILLGLVLLRLLRRR